MLISKEINIDQANIAMCNKTLGVWDEAIHWCISKTYTIVLIVKDTIYTSTSKSTCLTTSHKIDWKACLTLKTLWPAQSVRTRSCERPCTWHSLFRHAPTRLAHSFLFLAAPPSSVPSIIGLTPLTLRLLHNLHLTHVSYIRSLFRLLLEPHSTLLDTLNRRLCLLS